jgi:preprotein translocase subunit YajC
MGISMYNVLAASSSSKGSSGGSFEFILFAVAIFALVYMFMIRPQQRRRQQAAQQANTIAPGARVRTTAGMYATVVEVDGDDVVLEVAPGIEVRYMKRAIMDVVSPGDPVSEDTYEADADASEDTDEEYESEDESEDGIDAEADESPEAEAEEEAPEDSDAYEKATGSTHD